MKNAPAKSASAAAFGFTWGTVAGLMLTLDEGRSMLGVVGAGLSFAFVMVLAATCPSERDE
jgi:hypothetical protein